MRKKRPQQPRRAQFLGLLLGALILLRRAIMLKIFFAMTDMLLIVDLKRFETFWDCGLFWFMWKESCISSWLDIQHSIWHGNLQSPYFQSALKPKEKGTSHPPCHLWDFDGKRSSVDSELLLSWRWSSASFALTLECLWLVEATGFGWGRFCRLDRTLLSLVNCWHDVGCDVFAKWFKVGMW